MTANSRASPAPFKGDETLQQIDRGRPRTTFRVRKAGTGEKRLSGRKRGEQSVTGFHGDKPRVAFGCAITHYEGLVRGAETQTKTEQYCVV